MMSSATHLGATGLTEEAPKTRRIAQSISKFGDLPSGPIRTFSLPVRRGPPHRWFIIVLFCAIVLLLLDMLLGDAVTLLLGGLVICLAFPVIWLVLLSRSSPASTLEVRAGSLCIEAPGRREERIPLTSHLEVMCVARKGGRDGVNRIRLTLRRRGETGPERWWEILIEFALLGDRKRTLVPLTKFLDALVIAGVNEIGTREWTDEAEALAREEYDSWPPVSKDGEEA